MPEICAQWREEVKDLERIPLCPSYLSIAAKELREDALIRHQLLEQFREWISQNRDIENCITDDNFLLRFLRAKKFSLPMAQQMLLKYLNFRRVFKSICYDMDYRNPNVYDLIDRGFLFATPYRDSYDRRVIVCTPNKIDPYRHTSVDISKTIAVTVETLLNDEENQVLGFTYVGDGRGITPAYVAMWNVTEFATLLKWGEIFEYERDLHKVMDPKSLPKEYGGVMESSKMIELWKAELESKRERLLSFDSMKLLSDKGIITRRHPANYNDITGLSGSFRKLEVD